MGRLTGQTALITGGGSGIGKATAKLFLEEGAKVVLADINEQAIQETLAELPRSGNAFAVVGDIRSMDDAANMIQVALDSTGRLDVLFCCAGVPSVSPILDLEEAEWDAVIDTNLKGTFCLVKSAIQPMQEQGAGVIITMGSDMAFVAVPESPAYCASKGGIVLFTRAIAQDLIRRNIRVNCLCPGTTDTPLLQIEIQQHIDAGRSIKDQTDSTLLGRIARPEEIARGALFLASDDSSFAVGSCLVLDGGNTIR